MSQNTCGHGRVSAGDRGQRFDGSGPEGTEVGLQTQVKNCIVSDLVGGCDCHPHSLVFVLASATKC